VTKSELIANIASHFSHLTNLDTTLYVQNILDNLTIAMVNDDRIEIRGFGSFSVIVRAPRVARNPKTGKKVDVSAKHVPHFKPGLELKKRVL
jgi:integration host factor subunit beta